VWNGGKTTSTVWRQKKIIPQYYEHPTEKPIDLMMEAIGLFTHPDGLVFDPFMGSGTTVIAAKKLGRRAIGIDIDERWCEMAVNRLRQEVLFK
jgi:site-specific DNA-methyltransferase (adenine-specific)